MLELLQDKVFWVIPGALVVFWLIMRTRSSEVTSDSALSGIVKDGKPTVMEFFSNG